MASLITGSHIYTGAWIDWSKGAVAGSTITLSARYGALLTAFLAFFVTIIGACLWRIICYFLHQFFATAEARDGIHHQHQVILRNTSSAAAAGRAFAENAFSWRKTGMKSWSRSLPLAALATFFMVGFGVASLLTSLVTKSAGSARLVISDNCGFWAIDSGSSVVSRTAMGGKDLADTVTASNYARTCYGGKAEDGGLQCDLFTKKALTYTADTKADCPFGDKICNVSAFSLDTNRLSSLTDLGINTPKSGRVDFRKVTKCAPLNQAGYVSKSNVTAFSSLGVNGDIIRHYAYGGWQAIDGMANDTWVYNQHAVFDRIGYQFEALIHYAGDEGAMAAWNPIPALKPDSADTTIMFLAPNGIQFSGSNKDPFFHANIEIPFSAVGEADNYYKADEWVNVMACTDQYQICNPLLPDSQACTPLVGTYGVMAATDKIGLNAVQQFTAMMIYYNFRATSIYHSIYNRGAAALRAQETVNLLAQAKIPDNQWQIEVASWFDTGLAKLQRNIMSFAAGPEHVETGAHIQPPTGPIGKAMCYSQKVATSSNTVSFSVLGVAVILVVGAVIILVWLVIEMVVSYLQRRYEWGDYRRVRWIMDDKMQLQRMAFEEAGMGNWSKLSSNVPVTKTGEVFGGLGHVDPEQPRLGEKWATENKSGLAAAAVANALTTTVTFDPNGGRLTAMPTVNDKKNGPSIYERPLYHPITPPEAHQGH